MIVSIMQPAYLPWLGYFNRIWLSDVHIVLDHVKIDRNSKTKFANRNKVRTKSGWCWLTVPIKTKEQSDRLEINKLRIADEFNWSHKHWSTIKHNYAKTTFFRQHKYFFKEIYSSQKRNLNELINDITNYLLQQLEIKTEILYSSNMNPYGEKDELILDLCKKVGAKKYISGIYGKDYIHKEKFFDSKIEIAFHNYNHPVYPQQHPGFEPFMSIIDLLFNCGPTSAQVIRDENHNLIFI